nr:MAG TPA: type VI secretion protein [Caudoviricetes sp.]
MENIRLGRISTFDTESGTASVYYPDRGKNATKNFPILAPFGIAQKFEKEDLVVVMYFSNSEESGVILGGVSEYGSVPKANTGAKEGALTVEAISVTYTAGGKKIDLKELAEKVEAMGAE